MIRFTLKCADEHRFESWFHSSEAFEAQCKAGLVTCPRCGSDKVGKALMTPDIRPDRARAKPLSTPASKEEAALAALKAKIEAESEYVGGKFATEARAIHSGEAPERVIHGEAKLEDAKALLEDGVPVAPLPFRPARKVN